MRTIYVDSDFKCHVTDDGTMTAVETVFFDGKCDIFVEGYCCEINKDCDRMYPWKPLAELDEAQRSYERELLVDLQANSIPISELEASYQEGVNGAYD